jgi:hypothetical protein
MEHGCRIAPRTFYAWLNRQPSKRALWDMTVTEVLAGYYEPDEQGRRKPESLYGATKMWAHLHREGIEVARCTVERLMRANGWQGVTRTKKVRTTVADPAATRPPDLVDRQFTVPAPNMLVVADIKCRRRHLTSPTHLALGRSAVKLRFSKSGNFGAALSWRVNPLRRVICRATSPWRRIDSATVFSLTVHPSSRRSACNRGEPCRPLALLNATATARSTVSRRRSRVVCKPVGAEGLCPRAIHL